MIEVLKTEFMKGLNESRDWSLEDALREREFRDVHVRGREDDYRKQELMEVLDESRDSALKTNFVNEKFKMSDDRVGSMQFLMQRRQRQLQR